MSINKPSKYTKMPITIEAIQWVGWNASQVKAFCPSAVDRGTYFVIHTLDGNHICDKGDFIIKGVKGEFYPCRPDIFEVTYTPAAGGIDKIINASAGED